MTKLRFNNKAYGNIKGGISAGDTSIELYPGHTIDFTADWNIPEEMYLTITDAESNVEIIRTTGWSGDTFIVSRGTDGSTARAWPDGAVITQRLPAAALNNFIQKEYRETAVDPNGILTADYAGEKVYQTGQKIWWKNRSGTDWQLIAGKIQGWIARTCPAEVVTLGTICWSPGLGLFCALAAVGGVDFNSVIISPDGKVWTVVTLPVGPTSGYSALCWSPELGKFLAIGEKPAHTMYYALSPNGADWTLHSIADTYGTSRSLTSVCWSPSRLLFCAISGQASLNYAWTSPDGYTWTRRNLPAGVDQPFYGIKWIPESGRFIAQSPYQDPTKPCYAIYSDNGIDWVVDAAMSSTATIMAGSYRPATSAACYVGGAEIYIWDGAQYVSEDPQGYMDLTDVCWSPLLSIFVAVGQSDTGQDVLTSSAGTSWALRDTPEGAWVSVCWSPELKIFCAVGPGATTGAIMTSEDGGIF